MPLAEEDRETTVNGIAVSDGLKALRIPSNVRRSFRVCSILRSRRDLARQEHRLHIKIKMNHRIVRSAKFFFDFTREKTVARSSGTTELPKNSREVESNGHRYRRYVPPPPTSPRPDYSFLRFSIPLVRGPGRVSWATSTTTPNERPQKNSSNLSPSVAYYQSPRQSQIGLPGPWTRRTRPPSSVWLSPPFRSLIPRLLLLSARSSSRLLSSTSFSTSFSVARAEEGATTHAAWDPGNRICK